MGIGHILSSPPASLSKINGPEGLKIRKICNESVAGGRISKPGPGNPHLKGGKGRETNKEGDHDGASVQK
jgi:hypothetical protein